jgi:TP901 family phage tail tape measure protein
VLNNVGLGFTFTWRDLASSGMMRFERAFNTLDDRVSEGSTAMSTSLKALGVGLGIITVGAATVAGAFAAASFAGEFEQQIAAIGAVSGATAEELVLLKNAAIDAGIATQFSPTQATVGLKALAQAGYNTQESLKLLIPVLDLAAGSLGGLTPESAAGLAAQAMKAFGLSVKEAGLAVDQMLVVNRLGLPLMANELPLALGTAARGAATLHQSLAETLISLGLVKGAIPGVERASTAVAVAMERMVDPKVQAALKGIGVDAIDATTKGFRPFLDVLGDMLPKLEAMSESKRSAFLLKTFGTEALGGISAIFTQLTNGVRTTTGETLKGADAVRYLRDQMAAAGGTAAAFRDKMLDTFAGQKQLMKGSLETLAILIGEPFAKVFKPIVGAAVDGLNMLLLVLRGMPMSVKTAFGSFILGAGVLTMLVGVVVTAVTLIVVFATALKVAAAALGIMLVALVPATAAVGVLIATLAGLRVAFRENLGGIADFVQRIGAQIQLFFQGLGQLIEDGGFSGAIRAELNKAENAGLKDFLIRVWMVAYRLQRIWEGFTQGFTRAIELAAGVFEELKASFADLGDALDGVFGDFTRGAAGLPSERFRAFGDDVGTTIGRIVDLIVIATTLVVRFTAGFLRGARSMWNEVEPTFTRLGESLGAVVSALLQLLGLSDQATGVVDGATSSYGQLGAVLGRVFVFMLGVAANMLADFLDEVAFGIRVIIALAEAFETVDRWIDEAEAKVADWFSAVVAAAAAAISVVARFFQPVLDAMSDIGSRIWAVLVRAVEGLKAFLQPVWDFFSGVGDKVMESLTKLKDFVIQIIRQIPAALLPSELAPFAAMSLSTEVKASAAGAAANTDATASRAAAASSAMPAAADASARADDAAVLKAALAAATAVSAAQAAGPPQVITLQVDGETLARVVNDANKGTAGRSFAPVPSY